VGGTECIPVTIPCQMMMFSQHRSPRLSDQTLPDDEGLLICVLTKIMAIFAYQKISDGPVDTR